MKAIILAAGKSTRMYPLTVTRPKPLLKIANRTIIEHNLEQLNGLVKEAILIVGYKSDMIKKLIGKKYKAIKITYIDQKQQLGTGHALLQAKEKIKGKFLAMNGDDLFFKEDIEKCLKHNYSVLTYKVKDISFFGAVYVKKGQVKKIIEKEKSNTKLANTGLYVLDDSVFNIKLKRSPRNEYEITDMINVFARENKINSVEARNWFPISYPWNLLEANEFLLNKIKPEIKGKMEDHVTIEGNVIVGKGTVIKSHTHIEGPAIIGENCVIGPHAYIRPDTSIGDNCKIRAEIVDSIIMDNTVAKHHSYLGHSVVGENVNFAAGSITADYRHDSKEHTTIVKDQKVETMRKKLGSFIGDDVRTGINTCIYPGRKIWPGQTTLPGEVVTKDKK